MSTFRPVSTLHMLVLERVDPKRNIARYAVVDIDEAQFDAASHARVPGRLQHPHVELRPERESASEGLENWLARKRRRGGVVARGCAAWPSKADRG